MIIYPYIIAFVFFWIGFLTSSMLWAGRDKRDASILGELGATSKREHGGCVHQGTDTQSQKVTVSDILTKPKKGARTAKAATNGTQKRDVKNV